MKFWQKKTSISRTKMKRPLTKNYVKSTKKEWNISTVQVTKLFSDFSDSDSSDEETGDYAEISVALYEA